jgi:hypothetical protein
VNTTNTIAGAKSASDAQQKILTALRELGKASAQQISEHAKLAYSTTTAKLRSLEATGLAHRERHPDGATIWQPADPATGTAVEQPAPEITTTQETPSTAKSKPSSKRNRPSGSKPKDKADSDQRTAASDPGPDRTRSDADDADDAGDAGDGAGDGQRARRPKGALRAEVLAVLQDHPDATFKVSQVCKHLPGASAGAIANALDKLVAEGTAKQVADKPATYQAE